MNTEEAKRIVGLIQAGLEKLSLLNQRVSDPIAVVADNVVRPARVNLEELSVNVVIADHAHPILRRVNIQANPRKPADITADHATKLKDILNTLLLAELCLIRKVVERKVGRVGVILNSPPLPLLDEMIVDKSGGDINPKEARCSIAINTLADTCQEVSANTTADSEPEIVATLRRMNETMR